jgi:hypothetical protein
MKKLLIIILIGLQITGCKSTDTTSDLTPQSSVNVPELGDYFAFDGYIAPDNFKYDYRTNQWEWKVDIKLQLTPSPFGRLRFNKNGTYEFLDLNKSGTYKLDSKSKKIVFTGYMADAVGYFKIARSWCRLVIQATSKDGSLLSIVYEKKSDFPQPDIKDPNGSFKGTLVNMLTKTSADYIDIASAKTVKSHNSTSFPINGYSKYSVSIYKKNFLDTDEIYPIIEIKDTEGNLIKKFEKTFRSEDKWDIGDYWYGMISPDGTKLALVGQYRRYVSILDPKYITPYHMISVIDVKTGNEIYSYTLDNQNRWGPGWTPNGELVMPRKGGGIILLDANLKNLKTVYTKPVNDARINQNNKVLFAEGTGIFTMDSNGQNITQVKSGNTNLSAAKLTDLGWSPDGKSMAFVYGKEIIKEYNILLLNETGTEAIFMSDTKGDEINFISPFLNWK